MYNGQCAIRLLALYRRIVIVQRMAERDIRMCEVTFCSRVSKWADALFAQNPAWGFKRSEIEESKGIERKRSDWRVYGIQENRR